MGKVLREEGRDEGSRGTYCPDSSGNQKVHGGENCFSTQAFFPDISYFVVKIYQGGPE